MSDKTEQTSNAAVAEEVDKTTKDEKPVEKVENGDKAADEKNGDSKEKVAENGTEESAEENGEPEPKEPSSIKRKSTSGKDATDSALAENATPEKKAKLEEKPESDVKETSEVEA